MIQDKGQAEQLPKAFSTYDEAGGKIYQERALDDWMNVVQISATVVVALAFVTGRSHRTHVTHAIHLLLKLMMRVTDEEELKITVTDFLEKGSRLSKLVERGARNEDFEVSSCSALMNLQSASTNSGKHYATNTQAPTT